MCVRRVLLFFFFCALRSNLYNRILFLDRTIFSVVPLVFISLEKHWTEWCLCVCVYEWVVILFSSFQFSTLFLFFICGSTLYAVWIEDKAIFFPFVASWVVFVCMCLSHIHCHIQMCRFFSGFLLLCAFFHRNHSFGRVCMLFLNHFSVRSKAFRWLTLSTDFDE